MAVVKARFRFASKAGGNARTTVVKVKTIQIIGQEEIFLFPGDLDIVKKVVNSLKTRNKFRNVIVSLTAEMQAIYQDEEENVIFNDEYLKEAPPVALSAQADGPDKSSRSLAKNTELKEFNGENSQAQLGVFSSNPG